MFYISWNLRVFIDSYQLVFCPPFIINEHRILINAQASDKTVKTKDVGELETNMLFTTWILKQCMNDRLAV